MDPVRGLMHLGLRATETTLDRALGVVRLVDTLLVATAVPPVRERDADESAWPDEEQADLDALSATLRARKDIPATDDGAVSTAPASTTSAPAKKTAPVRRATKKAPVKRASTKKATSSPAKKASATRASTKKATSSPAKKTAAKRTSTKKTAQKAPATRAATTTPTKKAAKRATKKAAPTTAAPTVETPTLIVLPDV